MPRDGANIYTQPFPDVASSTPIASAVYNGFTHDVAQDLNTPRPIVAGGTAANNVDTALFNLSAAKAAQVVTNYDTHFWIPGTFYSATTASGEPVDGHAFSGVAYIGEALANPPTNANVTIEARDTTDGKLYIRRKVAGSWGSWTLDGDLSGVNGDVATRVLKAGDTMTGMLVLPATAPTLGTHATNKTYVDGLDTTQKTYIDAAVGTLNGTNTTQDTAINNRVRYDAAQGLTTAQQTQARVNISAPLRSWLTGLALSTVGSSATFGIAAGEAADSTNVVLMQLASTYNKTTGAWTVGSGNGALDTGTIGAASWYHVFLIRRPDTGVVDVLVSLSPTTPTMPANYTQFRRIGAMKTASSLWVLFLQIGDEFLWDTPVLDVNNVAVGASALYALTVPSGISVKAKIQFHWATTSGGGTALIQSPLTTTRASAGTDATLRTQVGTVYYSGEAEVWTNTSNQIRMQATGAGSSMYVAALSWIDRRGRDG